MVTARNPYLHHDFRAISCLHANIPPQKVKRLEISGFRDGEFFLAATTYPTLIDLSCWAEARVKIARVTLTIKLDGNWSSFQLANSAPPLSVTDSAIAPSARIFPLAARRGHPIIAS